jgi:AbiV family abortive infection protein
MTINRYDASDLARGAYYAYEQAGLLLRDARSLYTQRRYSSAAVLAIFGSEELGRARIYLERRRTTLPSGSVSKRELELACRNHELKLAQGQVLIQFDPGREMPTDELLKLADKLKNRIPRQRHKLRVRSLYVDPSDSPSGWNRPRDLTRLECKYLVNEVVNDYAAFPEYYFWPDVELQSVLENWQKRPSPLPPKWIK